MFGFIDSTKEINTQGIGLGLNISKDIVQHFGGFIQCDSTWQIGSTFTFMFVLSDNIEGDETLQRCRNPIVKTYKKLDFNPKTKSL
jgi:signal transduction histidine kinase